MKKARRSRTTENTSLGDKISELLNTRGVSSTALRKIVDKFSEGEVQVSGKHVTSIQQTRFNQVKETIVLPLVDGGEWQWQVAHPCALVSMSVQHSAEMEKAFAQALQSHPCSVEKPWRLVVTFDEFTPGNMLKPHNRRKTMATNFSFMELEPSGDLAWWTMAVALSDHIHRVEGGWSRMLRDLLRMALGQPSGMQLAGIPMVVKGEPTMIFAKLHCLLSDGDGLRMALQWGGASSNKPCFRHWNVVKPGSPLSQVEGYVSTHCGDLSRFQVLSEEDLATMVDVAVEASQQGKRGVMKPSHVQEAHTDLGFKATEGGLLADPQLRSLVKWMDAIRYDWAHTFLADSMLGYDLWALVEAAKEHEVFSQKDVHDFLAGGWSFPSPATQQVKGTKWNSLQMIFSQMGAEANERAGTIKASMSDLLGLYRLMGHFVATRVASGGPLDKHVLLFKRVAEAVDLLLAVKHRRLAPRDAGRLLGKVLEEHMALLHSLGTTRLRPKLHWAFDVAECLTHDDYLVDAFRLERLHLRIKDIAEHCKHLGQYEAAVMAGVTHRHLNLMKEVPAWNSPCHLFGRVEAVPCAAGITIADKAMFHQEVFKVGHFVCRGSIWWVGSRGLDEWWACSGGGVGGESI